MAAFNWKHTGRFCVAAFCMDVADSMFFTAAPYLAMKFQAESLGLGALNAFRSFIYMLACLSLPAVLARVSRRRQVVAAVAGIALSMLLTAASARLWHLFAAGAVWAVFLSLYWPSVFGWMGDVHGPDELSRATGAVNLSWGGGFMLGGLAGGLFYSICPVLPFLLGALPPVAGCVLLLRGPADHAPAPSPPDTRPRPGARRDLAAAWLGNVSGQLLFGLMYGVFPRLGSDIGVTSVIFGVLMFFMGIGRMVVFFLGACGVAWLYDWRVTAGAQVLAAGMVATVACARSHLWLGAVFTSVGLGLGATYYRGLYASLAGGGSRSRRSGAHEAFLVVGTLLGSLGGGVLAERWHLRAPYLPGAGLVLLLVAVQAALALSARRASARRAAA